VEQEGRRVAQGVKDGAVGVEQGGMEAEGGTRWGVLKE